jgi:hypothetical protein
MSQYNTHELLELASLDVLGLLDADERESFERAFRAAPPALQAQIRREQLRIAGDDGLLPTVDPPLGLRARVLAAIREAVQGAVPRREVVGRIVPEIAPVRGVNRWWRAAAIGAAAAAVVFAFTTLQLQSDFQRIAAGNDANQTRDFFLEQYGAKFEKAFLHPNTRFVQFAPNVTNVNNPDGVSKAMLLLDPETKKGQLFLKNLSSLGGAYSLVITDENGAVATAVLDFHATGTGVERQDIEKLDLEGVRGLAIIETNGAKVNTLLKSRL